MAQRLLSLGTYTLATLLLSNAAGVPQVSAQPTSPDTTAAKEDLVDAQSAEETPADAQGSQPEAQQDQEAMTSEADAAEDGEAPVRVPGIFFDNSLNPIDFLGRELDVDDESSELLASMRGKDVLRESHDPAHTVRRVYTLNTHRVTHITHKDRHHDLDDELRQRLEVSIRYGQSDSDKERIDVTVHSADPSANHPSAPLSVRVPSAGLELHCWQRDFQIRCQRAKDQKEVRWPQWATLDMSDWFSRRPVRVGTRWRRNFTDAETAGWLDGRSGRLQASLELSESGPDAGEESSYIRGALSGDGELNVYHRVETMPIDGQIDMEFDHREGVVRHLTWQWDGELSSDGLLQGHTYKWARETSSTLRVRSTLTSSADDTE